jgi:hypothetical protein
MKNMGFLDKQDLKIIGECLNAVARGPFLPPREFHTLMGLNPKELLDIVDLWPNVDIASEQVQLAVNNSMNNLLGYPHHCEDVWPQYLSVPALEVARIFEKFRNLT